MHALYTIGHSNLEFTAFHRALRQHKIDTLVDVRSVPRSRWVPHFSQPAFEQALRKAGIEYIFLGEELGGRPADPNAYRANGRVDYRARPKSSAFRRGIERVLREHKSRSVALMCAEEDPLDCHRFLMISPEIAAAGVPIQHVRRGGALESHSQTEDRLLAAVKFDDVGPGSLFANDRAAALEKAYEARAEEYAYRKKPKSGSAKKKARAAKR